ncbi:hypothetical protein [Embleya sp. NPDC020630]|uniref:hypothetical protein n=1 Tax=Embleya sp. NPDC020630 TaxID=3363979 RepID=UPI0037888BAA
MTTPTLRLLSLGAGVQSTTLLLLAADGAIPTYDYAIFADTGWEPRAVYDHLDALERYVAEPARIPILRVTSGNLRADALDPDPGRRFAAMPVYILYPDGTRGMGQRQCTNQYKLRIIKRTARGLLGYPGRAAIPADVHATQDIGISRDEIGRAKDSGLRYLVSKFPLLDLPGSADGRTGWTRSDCSRYLRAHGWASTPRSACIGCPLHGNRTWRQMRDERPDEWADAVAFDHALRATPRPSGIREYLHRSCVPLDEAPIDRVTRHEWSGRQVDVFDAVADQLVEDGDPDGCSPWGCRSGTAVAS